jgi:hypothetical protein
MRYRHIRKPTEFRLIRGQTMEHTAKRLRKHIVKLQRRMHYDRFMQLMRIKGRRHRREKSCTQT